MHIKYKFIDPLVSTGYLFRDRHPVDGRKKIFEKRVSAEEMREKQRNTKLLYLRIYFPRMS